MRPTEPPLTVHECDAVRIRLASPQEIRSGSKGEVTSPATLVARVEWKCRCGALKGSEHKEQKCSTCGGPVKSYRTLTPEKDGLFCERIFGPIRDWQCACGHLQGMEFKNQKCDRCGVEVEASKVRRQRVGHIELAAPVVHPWFHQSRPSLLGILLDIPPDALKKVLSQERKIVLDPGTTPLKERQILTEEECLQARKDHGESFQTGTGVEAIRELLQKLKLEELADQLRAELTVLLRAAEREPKGKKGSAANVRLTKAEVELAGALLELRLPDMLGLLSFRSYVVLSAGSTPLQQGQILTDTERDTARREHGSTFEVSTGPEAVARLLELVNLQELSRQLHADIALGNFRRAAVILNVTARQLERVVGNKKYAVTHPGEAPLEKGQLVGKRVCRKAQAHHPGFKAVTGVAAVPSLLEMGEIPAVLWYLKKQLVEWGVVLRRNRQEAVTRRLQLIDALQSSGTRPEWMVLEAIPVIPPDLRPIRPRHARRRPTPVTEAGSQAQTSAIHRAMDEEAWVANDLNYLYQQVVSVSNRLRKYLSRPHVPEVIVGHEKRRLQQAVDALFDNAHCSRPMLGTGNNLLKSLTDLIQGKQGRFRQNLLGKRVDFSARSVIVVGPGLKLEQCGLPRIIALELFQPFIIRRLGELIAHQLRLPDYSARLSAKLLVLSLLPRMASKGRDARVRHALMEGLEADLGASPTDPEAERLRQARLRWAGELIENKAEIVDEILREVVKDHRVLLNRAPTLHRMNVQAFEPVLIEGKAIQIHPMVCEGFGADFDGDAMAVHLPLSVQARVEAAVLLTPAANLLNPANGRPIIAPSQDIVLGCYYLTAALEARPGVKKPESCRGEGMVFSDPDEVLRAYAAGQLGAHARIQVRLPVSREIVQEGAGKDHRGERGLGFQRVQTTAGRVIFNEIVPPSMPFYDLTMSKKNLTRVIVDCLERCGRRVAVTLLDRIKELGIREATRSGLSFVVEDLLQPTNQKQLLADTEKAVSEVWQRYQKGQLTDQQRYEAVIELWTDAQKRITEQLEGELKNDCRDGQAYLNPIYVMAHSGARSKWVQVRQLAALRGLMDRPAGERRTLEHPITSSLRQGLTIPEYFLSTHGARKAGADKDALPDAGYLTRKLVDVAQHVIVTQDDCGTRHGIKKTAVLSGGKKGRPTLGEQVVGRCSLQEIRDSDNKVIVPAGEPITRSQARALEELKVAEVWVRSPITCEAPQGVCRRCYGLDLAVQALVDEGTPVGVIAAQSIGEPATQLAMKTKHTGGVAGEQSMVTALEQVTALFDLHRPHRSAVLARVRGIVRLKGSRRTLTVEPVEGAGPARAHLIPRRAKLLVKEGQLVEAGEPLTDDAPSLQEMLRLAGREGVAGFLLRQLQAIYRGNGVAIDDKHFEVILAQMLSRVRVMDGGDTGLLPGAVVGRLTLEVVNRRLTACVKIDMPGDSSWRAGMIVDEEEHEKALERLQKEGKRPPTHLLPTPARGIPILLGITQAGIQAESFLAAASFQRTSRVLAEAALAGKVDPLLGLKENVILGRLVPAGTGFPLLRQATLRLAEDPEP